MKKKKGFTLIELLVVITIIGILSAAVLVSLNSARNKAKDARIIAAMGQIRKIAAQVQYDKDDYTYLCTVAHAIQQTTDASYIAGTPYGNDLTTLASDITSQGGGTPVCWASDSTYCISTVMNTGTYCIGGAGKTGTSVCTVANTCD